jgi:acyl-coenzyme A synthetase/AMP-(fatty) acid ligase
MKVFDRNIIHNNFKLKFKNKVINKKEMIELINRWHTVFDSVNLNAGDIFSVNDLQSSEHLSLFIAAAERKLIYAAIPRMEIILEETDAFSPKSLDIKILFERVNGEKSAWNIEKFVMDDVYNYDPKKDIEFHINEDDKLLITKTSGSTGAPKVFYHTHKSLMFSTFKASEMFYKDSDTVLLFTSLNHVGVITIQILPVIISGCFTIALDTWDPTSSLDAIIDYKPNKTLLFHDQIENMKKLPRWNETNFEFLEEVISGGIKLPQIFIETLLIEKKVKTLYNVYGLSETPPPVYVYKITAENVNTHSKDGNNNLGDLVNSWDVVISENNTLTIKGDGLAKGHDIEKNCNNNGYYDTKDLVTVDNNDIWFVGRANKTIRRNDVLISIGNYYSTLSSYRNEKNQLFKSIHLLEKDNKLLLLLTLDKGMVITLNEINDYIDKTLGYSYRVDEIIETKGSWEYDQIKEVIKIS